MIMSFQYLFIFNLVDISNSKATLTCVERNKVDNGSIYNYDLKLEYFLDLCQRQIEANSQHEARIAANHAEHSSMFVTNLQKLHLN